MLEGDGVGDGKTWEGTRESLRLMGIGKQGRRVEIEIYGENLLSYQKDSLDFP